MAGNESKRSSSEFGVERRLMRKPIAEIIEMIRSCDSAVPGLPILEHPYEEAKKKEDQLPEERKLRSILLTALSKCSSGYWKGLASDWIKDGFPLDAEICEKFEAHTRRDKNVIQKKRQDATTTIIKFQQNVG